MSAAHAQFRLLLSFSQAGEVLGIRVLALSLRVTQDGGRRVPTRELPDQLRQEGPRGPGALRRRVLRQGQRPQLLLQRHHHHPDHGHSGSSVFVLTICGTQGLDPFRLYFTAGLCIVQCYFLGIPRDSFCVYLLGILRKPFAETLKTILKPFTVCFFY